MKSSIEAPWLLLVENDPSVLEALKEALEIKGNHVMAASDAEHALLILDRNPSRLVIIDYGLPGMNGGEAARRICRLWPRIPIIGMSAQRERKESMLDAGATYFLAKPIDPAFLNHLVLELVSA